MNLGEPSPHPDPLPSHQNGSGEGTGRGHQLLFNAKSMRQVHGPNAGEKIERRLSMNRLRREVGLSVSSMVASATGAAGASFKIRIRRHASKLEGLVHILLDQMLHLVQFILRFKKSTRDRVL